MKFKKGIGFLIMLIVVTQTAPAANALPMGAMEDWFGDAFFEYYGLDGRALIGQIDYAVYEVDDYPGSAPSGGQYIYAYQVINSGVSDVGAESFSACILEGAEVGNINWDDYQATNGIKPSFEYFSPDSQAPQSARFLFLPGLGPVGSGQTSVNLLFSSDNGPTDGFGFIEGGGIGGAIESLPTPVPEPATFVLLGIGLMALARKGKTT